MFWVVVKNSAVYWQILITSLSKLKQSSLEITKPFCCEKFMPNISKTSIKINPTINNSLFSEINNHLILNLLKDCLFFKITVMLILNI